MAALPKEKLSPAEYLAMERASEERHAYLDGELFAMTGASRPHNLITANILAALHGPLKRRGCEVYAADMRVHVPATGLYTYPDVVVVCGEPAFQDDAFDTLLNPRLIVEVLSPSTEDHDRGIKFVHYRSIEGFSDYLVVAQDRLLVEHWTRQGDGRWLLTEHRHAAAGVELESIGTALDLATVYDGVPGLDPVA